MADVDDLMISVREEEITSAVRLLGQQREKLQDMLVRRWERRADALALARSVAAHERRLLNQKVVCEALGISDVRLWVMMREGTIRWAYDRYRVRKIPASELARLLAAD